MTTGKQELRIGIIGLDTSHVEAFAELLNDPENVNRIEGGRITTGYPGGSPDFEMSISRVESYTQKLRKVYGVSIVGSPEAVAQKTDAILITTVDGRKHLEQFNEIACNGKPVFIDKPFATKTSDASAIASLARKYSTPLMSCSGLRFSQALREALESNPDEEIVGADISGPMPLQDTQPGFFWYGIHTAEALYRIMGRGCREVRTATSSDHDAAIGIWEDGRIGTIRGNRCGSRSFYGVVHFRNHSQWIDFDAVSRPNYAYLMDNIMEFFHTRRSPVDLADTLEITRFLEAANESRAAARMVRL